MEVMVVHIDKCFMQWLSSGIFCCLLVGDMDTFVGG